MSNFRIPFSIKNYHKLATRTMPNIKPGKMLENAVLGLCGESGEVADLYKKFKFQGHVLEPEEVIKELGDVLWYIAEAAEALNYTLEQVAEINIDKLRLRYPEGFNSDKSINR